MQFKKNTCVSYDYLLDIKKKSLVTEKEFKFTATSGIKNQLSL